MQQSSLQTWKGSTSSRLPDCIICKNYPVALSFQPIKPLLQTGTNKARLKQAGKNFLLVADDMKSMSAMHSFLKQMHAAVVGAKEASLVS